MKDVGENPKIESTEFCGVDYGSKLAGTTTLVWVKENKLRHLSSVKGIDADEFLKNEILSRKFKTVFIDAPLSLPKVYTGHESNEFFYREADKELRAMSPMFLGGLTARALKLKSELADEVEFYECYPAYLVRGILHFKNYAKKVNTLLPRCAQELKAHLPFPLEKELSTWHDLDAYLAWFSGWRTIKGENRIFGDPAEGQIYV